MMNGRRPGSTACRCARHLFAPRLAFDESTTVSTVPLFLLWLPPYPHLPEGVLVLLSLSTPVYVTTLPLHCESFY